MGWSHLLGVVLLTNLRILLFLHQIWESKDLANRIMKRCQDNKEAKVLSWGHLCLSSQCSHLWILTECSLLAVLKKGLESQSLMRMEVEGCEAKLHWGLVLGVHTWSENSHRLWAQPYWFIPLAFPPHYTGRRHSLLSAPRCPWQLSSDALATFASLLLPLSALAQTSRPPPCPRPVIHLHSPPKAASLPLLLTSCSWGMRSLRPCLFEPMSPPCAWKIMLRRIWLLLSGDTMLGYRTQGIIWQSHNCLGQNLYKNNSSCRTSGQMWKQTSVPCMYFILLLCFPSPGNATAPAGCLAPWRLLKEYRKEEKTHGLNLQGIYSLVREARHSNICEFIGRLRVRGLYLEPMLSLSI